MDKMKLADNAGKLPEQRADFQSKGRDESLDR